MAQRNAKSTFGQQGRDWPVFRVLEEGRLGLVDFLPNLAFFVCRLSPALISTARRTDTHYTMR
jgi:hypothetical protein